LAAGDKGGATAREKKRRENLGASQHRRPTQTRFAAAQTRPAKAIG
jgi:hypothetical protein